MAGDELAKRFDYLLLAIEYADLKRLGFPQLKMKVIATADQLSTKGSIAMVKRQEELITRVQTEQFWTEADLFQYEIVRKAFRDLIKFLDASGGTIYYTDFTDQVLEVKENCGEYTVNNLQSYRKKVNQYLKEHQDDLVIYKLRNNRSLSGDDVKYLEKVLWQELGTKEDYQKEYGDEPLVRLVSKLVGLDPLTANQLFSEFLTDQTLTSNQMEFVKLIVNFVINHGMIDKTELNGQPFNKFGSVVHLFKDKLETANRIIRKIDQLNARIDAG